MCLVSQIVDIDQALNFTVLVNQSASHAIPAVLNSISSALLRSADKHADVRLSVTNHPLPILPNEAKVATDVLQSESLCLKTLGHAENGRNGLGT